MTLRGGVFDRKVGPSLFEEQSRAGRRNVPIRNRQQRLDVDADRVQSVFGDRGAMGALREAKKQGVVKFIGASGHLHPTRFHEALDSGEIDVLMNAVNFVVQHTYDFEHKVWSRAHKLNVGLVAMKVLGGAVQQEGGFKVDEKFYERAIRYALSVPGIAVAVIGLENIPELEKAAAVVARSQPLSPEESLELARAGLEFAGTPEWKAPYGTPLA